MGWAADVDATTRLGQPQLNTMPLEQARRPVGTAHRKQRHARTRRPRSRRSEPPRGRVTLLEERMPVDAATTEAAVDTRRRRTRPPGPHDQRPAPRRPRAASRERRTDPGSPRSRYVRRTRTAATAAHRRGRIVPAASQHRHAAGQPNHRDPEQDHPAQPRTSSAHDRLRPDAATERPHAVTGHREPSSTLHGLGCRCRRDHPPRAATAEHHAARAGSPTCRNCSPEAKARSYSPTTIASKRAASRPGNAARRADACGRRDHGSRRGHPTSKNSATRLP